MCVVAIGDTSDRMTEDLDRRLWNVRVVVGGTRLPKVLEQPRSVFTRLDIRFGPKNTGALGSGAAGMILLMWACTTRFIGR